jgi:hypothetical protein
VADDRVTVVFGAQVAELIAGVTEAKEAIESIAAPVHNFVAALGGVAEAIAAAFAVERIAEFAEKFAELGEKAQNTAFLLGASASR